jgi:HAD superfamily hydrolase (TIGR01509 family)
MIKQAIQRFLTTNNYAQLLPKAVLFDMDGVLYDSMDFHAKAWKITADQYHLKSTEAEFYLYEGRTGRSTINLLVERTLGRPATEQEKKDIYTYKSNLFNQINQSAPMQGAASLIDKVRAAKLSRLVVTGSGQELLIDKISANFPQAFERELMVTANDVTHGKPHPEPYLQGLAKAQVQPYEAIVIENAPLGVESAVAAGIFTIAVNTGPLPEAVLREAGAHLLYPSMDALVADWETIMDSIAQLNNI